MVSLSCRRWVVEPFGDGGLQLAYPLLFLQVMFVGILTTTNQHNFHIQGIGMMIPPEVGEFLFMPGKPLLHGLSGLSDVLFATSATGQNVYHTLH